MAGTFRLESDDPRMSFQALLGDGPATVSGGYGGWNVVQRPRRIGITQWDGIEPLSLSVPFLIDGLADDNTPYVERSCAVLERMAGVDPHTEEPPQLKVDGGGAIPHDYTSTPDHRWLLNGLEWGDSVRAESGGRLRQSGSLTLLQFVEDEHLRDLKPPAHRRKRKKRKDRSKSKRGAKDKTYTVKSGDSLASIAARELGSAGRWKEIAKLNNIRDPNRISKGQKLRLP